MAPDIFEMIAYCKSRGIACGFNSNGTLLTKTAAERLVDLGLDWLHVSLDGAGRETYEFVREHSSWDVVQRNVGGLVDTLRRRGAERPQLSLVMVLMRFNFRDLPAVVERAAEWGIPRVRAQNLSHDFSDAPPGAYASIAEFVRDQALVGMAPSETGPVLEQARQMAAARGISLRLPNMAAGLAQANVQGTDVPCAWPWRSSYVTWNGDVQPCCMVMGSDRAKLGNARAAGFAGVWTNDEYQDFRRRLLESDPPAVCRGCSEYRGTF
jgi:radical SAM protein with 4Fe4S-binding SPASM domain